MTQCLSTGGVAGYYINTNEREEQKMEKTELDFVYETTLARALNLGYSPQQARERAAQAVKDHWETGSVRDTEGYDGEDY